MIRRVIVLACVAMPFTGCKAKPADPAAAPSASVAPAAAPATAAATGGDIPTEEDFEQEALDQVNAQNLEAQLAKLEADIGP